MFMRGLPPRRSRRRSRRHLGGDACSVACVMVLRIRVFPRSSTDNPDAFFPRPHKKSSTGRVSEEFLALARGEDSEHLAVLGHRAPSNLDAIAPGQKLDDLLVG